jgi:hypothetical protein
VNQIIYLADKDKAIYSASVVDTVTDFCFWAHQLMVASPRQNTYPEHDFQSSKKFP